MIENLGGHEGFEVMVVSADLDRVFGSFEVMTPVFHGFDNCEHFAIVNVVVTLSRYALARPESDGVKATFRVGLTENAGDRKAGGVGVERRRQFGIEVTKNRRGGKLNFEFVKCS